MFRKKRTYLIIAIIVAVSVLSYFWITRPIDLPPIVRDLSGNTWAEESAAFDSRVRQTFPAGTAEQRVMDELQKQDFSVGTSSAILEKSTSVCNLQWTITWSANTKTREINQIHGVYGERGCL